MSVPTFSTCMQSGRRMGPGESDSKSRSLIQKVKIYSELQIPAGYDSMSIYKSLKHTLQDAYRFSLWFDVKFEGLATQLWKFEARLNIGATISLRSKFRALILKVFEDHLSPEQFLYSKAISVESQRCCKSKKILHLSRKINRIHGRETDFPTLKT
jgi:hypothetical protein